MKKVYCVGHAIVLTILIMASTSTSMAAQNQFWVFIGTDTHPPSKSKGIYLFRLDAGTGKVTDMGLAAELGDPGWQKISADGKFLYTVGNDDGHRISIAAAYRIDARTGALTFLNKQPTHGNDSPHLDVDPDRTCAVVANYGSGDMSVMPINPDGTLEAPTAVIEHSGSGVNPDRQKHPFPHSCNFDPTGKWVLTPDLGVDKVYVYRFDAATRSLSSAEPAWAEVKPGSGPRHLSFSPDGKFAYLINEMGGTVVVFAWDPAHGRLQPLQTVSTLRLDYSGQNTSAEVRVLPNGRFLYASNRGPDELAIFAINPTNGWLKSIGYQSTQGKGPRDFAIDPTGTFLLAANQYSDSVVMFRIDSQTGLLTPTGTVLSAPTPICVKFLPVGN